MLLSLCRCGPASLRSSMTRLSLARPALPHNSNFQPVKLAIRASGSASSAAPAGAVVIPRAVGWWLLGCGGMTFGAIALGGFTRLTESGLSMVDWKLFGRRPPANDEEWQEEFEKYKQSPEFQLKNSEITMSDFKFIWHMEYGHRMWGRLIGAAFYIPAAAFWAKGYFPTRGMKVRVGVMGLLLAGQGLLGWYMVKSGLDHKNFESPNAGPPRVSQYRLAAHLTAAMVLYSALFWNGLEILLPKVSAESIKSIFSSAALRKSVLSLRKLTIASKTLIFFTAVSGAFVAGLDAGLTYNTFPLMADRFIPTDLFAYVPWIKNFTENPTTVQFDHRVLGTSTLALITYLTYRAKPLLPLLPPRARAAVITLFALGWGQVGLGILTLLTFVPTPLAAAHQSGAILTFSSALWLANELQVVKVLKHLPK